MRDGVPNPGRVRAIGSYTSRMPGAASGLKVKRKGSRIRAIATLRHGRLKPDAWVYILRVRRKPVAVLRAKHGRAVKFKLRKGTRRVSIAARPIVGGRVMKVSQRVKNVR